METLETWRWSLRDFLHVVFKRKNQIILFFLATVCTVVIGTFVEKPTYEAKAQILVKIGRENVYVPLSGNSGQSINYLRPLKISLDYRFYDFVNFFENRR